MAETHEAAERAASDCAGRRRIFGAIFFFGVACVVAFGCWLAAYDLWGGIPRRHWPLVRLLAQGGAVSILAGAIGWIMSWPAGRRLRALAWSAGILVLTAALVGGGLFAHYAIRMESSWRICAPALIAPTQSTRRAALREGLGPLFPVIDPHSTCLQLLREQTELAATGHCPTFVMNDVPCRCGEQHWEPGKTGGCTDGPTACQYRSELKTETLGCAAHGSESVLEEARSAERARTPGEARNPAASSSAPAASSAPALPVHSDGRQAR